MVLPNRLLIPPSDQSFLRIAVFEHLERLFKRRLVTVVAGGGYGKTTLIADYLRSHKTPTLWFSCHQFNLDFSNFIELLANGLSQNSELQINSQEIILLETLAHWSTPLAIVLDDFHLVESNEYRDFLLQLVHHSSSFVTFVVISRQRPSFPYTKLKVQNRLAEVSEQQLQFSIEETDQFFQHHGLVLTKHELQLVHTKTSGWPASLPLVLDVWKDYNPGHRKWERQLLPYYDLFEELETELLTEGLEFTSFLQQSSVLHEWDENFFTSFFPTQPKEWQQVQLKQRLFLRKNLEGKVSYLPLFRDYLYEKLLETQGKQVARQLHIKAAKLYKAQYHYYFAFAHYLAANCYGDAARIMQKMMNLYTPERFILLLDGSLEMICPSISMALFSHFLFRSVPMPILESYIEPLKQTLTTIKQQSLNLSVVYLEHRLGIVLYYTGEIEEAKTLFLSSYEGSLTSGHPELASMNLALAAQCCRFSSKLDEGIQLAKMALTNIEQGGTPDSRMHATWILTELLMEQNELQRAAPFVEELLRLSNEYDDEGARVYPLIAIGKYYRLLGDLEKSFHFTNQGMAEAMKFNLDTDLGWGYLELGMLYIQKAEKELAIEYLQKSNHYFSHYRYFSSMVNQTLQTVQVNSKTSETNLIIPEQTDKLSIKLFGSFQLKYGDQIITIKRKSSIRLFFYLAVHYQQKIPKDILLDQLFADGSYASQNNRFYVSLSTLRKALEPELSSARLSKYIVQTGELFSLEESHCEIDLAEFHCLMAKVEGQLTEERIADLKKAVHLYQGELLAEYPYETFLDPVREAAKQSMLHALQELGYTFFAKKDFTHGMHYFDQIFIHDPFTESYYWEYLQILVDNGLVSYAKQVGTKMEKAIEGDLGIPVSERLKKFFENN